MNRECGKVCEITVGLGCLSRYGGRGGLPFPLRRQGWVAFPGPATEAGLGCLSRCLRYRAGLPFPLCGRRAASEN